MNEELPEYLDLVLRALGVLPPPNSSPTTAAECSASTPPDRWWERGEEPPF